MLTGHCLCGAVQVTVNGAHDPRVGACHCRMCQRWSGGLFLCFDAATEGVAIEGPVTQFASSEFATRGFCSFCGSHLWFQDTGSDTINLMPGLFDDARDFPLRSEIYADRAFASAHLAGDHKRATRAEYEQENQHVSGDAP